MLPFTEILTHWLDRKALSGGLISPDNIRVHYEYQIYVYMFEKILYKFEPKARLDNKIKYI